MSVRFRRRIEVVPGWAGMPAPGDAVSKESPGAAAGADTVGDVAAAILAERTREPVDWNERVAPREAYRPRPFEPPEPAFSESTVAWEAARRVPLWPWAIVVAGAIWMALTVTHPALQAIAALPGLAAALWAWRVPGRRSRMRQRLLAEKRAAHDAAVRAEREAHERGESERAAEWDAEERRRARLREAESRRDAEPLAELLEAELSTLRLPVPVAIEFEFEGVNRVLVELMFIETPAPRDAAPVAGDPADDPHRAARAPGPARHHPDVLCAVVLRVVHEAIRSLPMIGMVEVVGNVRAPGGGDARAVPAVHVAVSRDELAELDLDDVAPATALEGMGGLLGFDGNGAARPLARVPGWAGGG